METPCRKAFAKCFSFEILFAMEVRLSKWLIADKHKNKI